MAPHGTSLVWPTARSRCRVQYTLRSRPMGYQGAAPPQSTSRFFPRPRRAKRCAEGFDDLAPLRLGYPTFPRGKVAKSAAGARKRHWDAQDPRRRPAQRRAGRRDTARLPARRAASAAGELPLPRARGLWPGDPWGHGRRSRRASVMAFLIRSAVRGGRFFTTSCGPRRRNTATSNRLVEGFHRLWDVGCEPSISSKRTNSSP